MGAFASLLLVMSSSVGVGELLTNPSDEEKVGPTNKMLEELVESRPLILAASLALAHHSEEGNQGSVAEE